MRLTIIIGLAAVLLMTAAVVGEEEAPWFDMENCGFCKFLLEDPELLPNTTWEHHHISNGAVSVTTVKEGFKESLAKAMAQMDETGKRMEAGEEVPMCGMCQAWGALMAKGAKFELVETIHGDVVLTTGDTPELIAEIQAFATRTTEELAKMEAAMKAEMKEHEGH
ncbi:MAG: hypothetical protein KAT79_07325 [candidate division Zixibacteria bacterium]|nr:hypothetical protein [candidate division Zixibacteria bacterium]